MVHIYDQLTISGGQSDVITPLLQAGISLSEPCSHDPSADFVQILDWPLALFQVSYGFMEFVLRQWSYSSALCCSRWPCWSTPGTDEARSGRSRKHHKLIQFWYDSVTKDMCKVTRCCVFECFEYRVPSVVRICQDDWGTAGPMQLRTCLLWTMRAERWRTTRPRRTSMLEEAMSVNVRDARKDENVQTIAGMWWLCMIDMSVWHGMTWHMRYRWRATLLRFAFCWMRSCRQSQMSQAERWCMRPGWLWLGGSVDWLFWRVL